MQPKIIYSQPEKLILLQATTLILPDIVLTQILHFKQQLKHNLLNMLKTNQCICSLKLHKGWLWKTDMKKNAKRINMGSLTVFLCLTLYMKEKNPHSQIDSYHFAILVKQEGNFSAISATQTSHFCTYKCQTSCRAQATLGVVQNIPPYSRALKDDCPCGSSLPFSTTATFSAGPQHTTQ